MVTSVLWELDNSINSVLFVHSHLNFRIKQDGIDPQHTDEVNKGFLWTNVKYE